MGFFQSRLIPLGFPIFAAAIITASSIWDYLITTGVSANSYICAIFIVSALSLIIFYRFGIVRTIMGILFTLILVISVRILLIQFDSELFELGIEHYKSTLTSCAESSSKGRYNGLKRCLIFENSDATWGNLIYYDPANLCFPTTLDDLKEIDNSGHLSGRALIHMYPYLYVKKLENNFCSIRFSLSSMSLNANYRPISVGGR